jgi:ATP-dependent DNA helicase PIF1
MLAGEDGMIVLDRVFRQKDTTFLRMLNELRLGYVSQETNAILMAKVRESALAGASSSYSANGAGHHHGGVGDDGKSKIVATKLFPKNDNVDSYNASELRKLPGDEKYDYEAVPGQDSKEPYLTQLMQGIKAPKNLELRIGAQVMLLKNVSTTRGLVNGARGVVVKFEKSQERSALYPMIPVVKFSVRLGEEVEEIEYPVVEDTWDIQVGGR